MTAPTEDEVRAHLEREAATMERSAETARMVRFDDSTHMRLAAIYRSALAMLDEARKDRERLDWIDGAFWCEYARSAAGIAEVTAGTLAKHLTTGEGDNIRAAIDQARGV